MRQVRDRPRDPQHPGVAAGGQAQALRRVLGQSLQTGAFRAILILAGFSFVGALVAYLVRRL